MYNPITTEELLGKNAPTPYPSGKKTTEELLEELERLEAEEIRFALEIVIEEKAKALRAIVLKRLEDVITLDDILQAFINDNLCRRVSTWATEKI